MSTVVITGRGPTGSGGALADTFLRRGDDVAVVGRSPAKGRALLYAAGATRAGDRTTFFRADLSLIRENVRVIEAIKAG